MGKFIFRRNGGLPKALAAELATDVAETRETSGGGLNGLFSALANTRLWRTSKQAPSYAGEVTKLYREVFTPSRPKQTIGEFTGRAETIASITQSIEEEQAHILLLGHRSLGKSSLLNIVAEAGRQAGYLVARIACTTDLTFSAFLQAIFEDLSTHLDEAPAGHVFNKQIGVERLSDLIDPSAQDVHSALQAFSRISAQKVLVLLDDFHRVTDVTMKRQLCDLLAALTGSGAPVSMVIASRDDGLDDYGLIHGEEPSGAVTVGLEPMRPDEISDMLLTGGRQLGIDFGDDILQSIIPLCQGIPAIAQWMGLLTVRRTLRRYDDAVTMDDVVAAAQDTAVKADLHACTLLDRVVASPDAGRLDDVLYLAARSSNGRRPEFSPTEINREAAYAGKPPYSEQGLHRLLARYAKGEGAIFERTPTAEGACYRFADPLTRSIVLLRNAPRHNPSDTEVLTAYLQHQDQAQLGTKADPSNEFLSWLQFVLTPEDANLYDDWALQDQAGSDEFRRRYRRAHDDRDLEILLREIQSVLASAAHEKPAPAAMDAA